MRIRALSLIVLTTVTLAACGMAREDGREDGDTAGQTQDPLAAEIERWSAFLHSKPENHGFWAQVKKDNQPVLARAEEALRGGHRLLAMQRLANARANLATAEYLSTRPAGQRKELAGFEAEWARMGDVLRADLKPSPSALDGVRPAALRALGEAALPQVRAYYDASLEYARNTVPEEGLYYLGSAQAQRELAELSRTLSAPSSRRAPPVRALAPDLDALETEMLAAYRPPTSIDRHGEFIVASSTLKEARELDAAGLRYGALLRYLEAALRFAPLRKAPPPAPESKHLDDLEARLAAGDVDHSLGQLFIEMARANPDTAAAIATDVLPRYFAAIEPARSEPPQPEPRVTVTLVRWPYT